jgi:hypothetical protein
MFKNNRKSVAWRHARLATSQFTHPSIHIEIGGGWWLLAGREGWLEIEKESQEERK